MAILWGMVVGVFGLTVLDEEDFSWSAVALVVAIAATITVVVFVEEVGWPETTRVEVHPHEIVTEAVSWWAQRVPPASPSVSTKSSVDLDYEDGRKLPKVQASGRALSGSLRVRAARQPSQ